MPRLRLLMPTAVLAGLAMLLPAAPAAAQPPPETVAPPAGVPAPVPRAAPERPRPAAGSLAASPRDAAREAEIAAAAEQVLALVDAGDVGEVWDGASGAIRRIVPREEFVRQVTRDRARLGKPLSRGEATLRRERFSGGGPVPQGDYLNVAFATRFGGVPQPVRELVSFRFDEDQVWRVSGYSVRGERMHDDGSPDDRLPDGRLRDDRQRGGNLRGEAEPAPDASGEPGEAELSVPPARRP